MFFFIRNKKTDSSPKKACPYLTNCPLTRNVRLHLTKFCSLFVSLRYKATVMLVSLLCWRCTYFCNILDNLKMLIEVLLEFWLATLMLVTKRPRLSARSPTCHQRLSAPKSVNNIDIAPSQPEPRSITRKYHLIKVFECVVILIVLIRKIFDVQFDFKTIK